MIYLILMIIAAVILVAVVIRRLPYLRTHKLGLEINRPANRINTSWLQDWWYQLKLRFSGFQRKRPTNYYADSQPTHMMPPTSYSATPPAPLASSRLERTGYDDAESPTVAHPEDFWQEEVYAPSPLEVPEKGLITRRGEAQKIAQELIAQAETAFNKKDYKDAEKYYLQAATKDPNNARIYNRLGVIYLNTKNYKDAVEAFRGALRFDDRIASRHYNLALAYMGKRDTRSAEKALREAAKLDPTNDKYRKTLESVQK